MSQDATMQVMGVTRSNIKNVTRHDSDPATYKAGLAISRSSTGALSLLKSAGQRIGVSLGAELSGTKRTAVCRDGVGVPVALQLKRATGTITVTSFANLLTTTPDTLTIGATVFTFQSGAATPGAATIQAATSNNATAASIVAQINAHATAGALVKAVANNAVVTVYSLKGGTGTASTFGNQIAVAYADNGGGNIGITLSNLTAGKLAGGSDLYSDIAYTALGAKAYCNDVDGTFDDGTQINATITAAVYASGVLTGIQEDGTNVPCALVDMQGGL